MVSLLAPMLLSAPIQLAAPVNPEMSLPRALPSSSPAVVESLTVTVLPLIVLSAGSVLTFSTLMW